MKPIPNHLQGVYDVVLEDMWSRELQNRLLAMPHPLIKDLDYCYFRENKEMKEPVCYVNGKKVEEYTISYENNEVNITYKEKFDLSDIVDNRISDLRDELESKFTRELGSEVSFKHYHLDDGSDSLTVSFIVKDEKWAFDRDFICRALHIPKRRVYAHYLYGEWVYIIYLGEDRVIS